MSGDPYWYESIPYGDCARMAPPRVYTGDPSLKVYNTDDWSRSKTIAVAIPPQHNRPSTVTEEQFVAGVEALIVAQRQRHETPAGQLRAALAAMNIGAPG
jgi:hypothetical protein